VIGIPGNSGAGTLNTTASQITQSVTTNSGISASPTAYPASYKAAAAPATEKPKSASTASLPE
jgi:hypothetical protein